MLELLGTWTGLRSGFMGTSRGPTRLRAKCCTQVRATPKYQYRLGDAGRRTWGYRCMKSWVWPSNVHLQLRKQTAPGAASKQHGQQVKEGDSPSLLHPHETPPGLLHPPVRSSVQERHWPVRVCPEMAHKIGQRDGMPHLWGKTETGGVETALGRSYCSLSVLKEGL